MLHNVKVHVSDICGVFECRADIALIGLAVMGQNLILNMNDHNFVVSATIHVDVLHFVIFWLQ